jgi:hypothetical protein
MFSASEFHPETSLVPGDMGQPQSRVFINGPPLEFHRENNMFPINITITIE